MNLEERTPQIRLPWEQSGWLEQVEPWIAQQLAKAGRRATGPLQIVHQRLWSAFISQETDQGLVYFKAPAPAYHHEPGLTEALARWRPDVTVPLLGVELERNWLLSAAAGETLRNMQLGAKLLAYWSEILPLYAELQIEMAEHLPEILGLGTPDRRLAQLPQMYEALLQEARELPVAPEDGLSAEEHARLAALRGRVAELCEQLAGYGLPPTLVHEEVTETNVISDGKQHRFTDWSDCCVGHPFFSMLVTERTLVHWSKWDEAGPELQRVRDAYLEPWAAFGSRAELLEAYGIAYRLSMVNRALSWRMALAGQSAAYRAQFGSSMTSYLQDFLEAMAAAEGG